MAQITHHHNAKKTATAFALASLAAELSVDAPRDFRLIPAGPFKSSDGSGRPVECDAWVMTDEDGARLVAEMSARSSARVIDYEHGTLHAKKTGTQAPAAGWFNQLEWRPGDGLWVIGADWTALAAQQIQDKQYRYISPVFSYDRTTGRVQKLVHAALTNDPGVDGLTDLAALAAEIFPTTTPQEESTMDKIIEQLIWLFNLPVASPVEDITAHLEKVIAQLKSEPAVAANSANFSLGEHLAALSAQIATPDPAKFAPVAALTALQGESATLRTQLAALQAEVDGGKLDKLIEDGRAAGKITPATEAWARDLGKSNLASLTAYIGSAPVVVRPGETQSNGSGQGSGGVATAALTAEEKKVIAALGLSVDQFNKANKED